MVGHYNPVSGCLNLFCGVGQFCSALGAAGRSGHSGRAVLIVGAGASVMQRNNQLESLHFLQAPNLSKTWNADWLAKPCDAALLDPRAHGAEQLVQQLADKAVGRILYVFHSNPATLARDARYPCRVGSLLQAGN